MGAIGNIASKTASTATSAGNTAVKVTKNVGGFAASTAAAVATGTVEATQHQVLDIYDRAADAPQILVDCPTPEDRWYVAADGWPSSPAELPQSIGIDTQGYKPLKWKPPRKLCPTAIEVPTIFEMVESKQIGELRLEVLQCESLKKLLVGTVDPYALIVVEGFAAQTHMVRNSRNPRWGADVARAFRFPITCSYSSINVTINDKLADPVNPDNCLGRLRIDLGSVLSRTIYDCWYELLAPSADYNGKTSIGSVRLRYSVTWKGERYRLTHYFRPPPTYFVVPVCSLRVSNSASH